MNSKTRILLCIDSDAERDAITGLLSDVGITGVEKAADMADAADRIGKELCDVVICDTTFSGREGIQLPFRCVKQNEQAGKSSPRFVVIGGREQSTLLTELENSGLVVTLTRPYSTWDFWSKVINSEHFEEEDVKNEKVKTDKLEIRISDALHTIGIPAHIKGYSYLRLAISMVVKEPEIINYVTKTLYPRVAREFGTSTSRVERAIRHAIEVAWDRGDIDTLNSIFGYTISRQRGKPTNSEFIAMIADKLRLHTI